MGIGTPHGATYDFIQYPITKPNNVSYSNRFHIQNKKAFPNTRFLSNSLLDVRTDACRRHPMEVHALLIDVPMFTLHRELHLMPKWHAKAFITPFIITSAANLMDVRRPADSGMESPLDTNTLSQPENLEA